MRKLTILLALAALTASNAGCCCGVCGRVRNWFHKGSPCGTAMAPAVLGAPLAMGTPLATPVAQPMMQPMMAQPMMSAPICVEQAPVCPQMCVPCDPCDPCGGGSVSTGYGGYGSEGCGCDGSSSGVPMTIESGSSGVPIQSGQVLPGPTP